MSNLEGFQKSISPEMPPRSRTRDRGEAARPLGCIIQDHPATPGRDGQQADPGRGRDERRSASCGRLDRNRAWYTLTRGSTTFTITFGCITGASGGMLGAARYVSGITEARATDARARTAVPPQTT